MIDDLMYYVGALFVVAVAIIMGFIIFDEINKGFQDQDLIPQAEKDFFEDQYSRYDNLDYSFLVIFIAVFIAILLISWVLATYPAFFVVFFFMIIILSGLAGYLSNAWADMSADTVLGLAMDNFPIINFIMNNYLLFIAVTTLSMIVVFFAKPQGGAV